MQGYVTGNLYNLLKQLAMIVLPTLGFLFFLIYLIWDLSGSEWVFGAILFLVSLFGSVLYLSSVNYHKEGAHTSGVIDIYVNDESESFMLNLDVDPEDLKSMDEVTFRINKVA
jgi:hypothetical protein